MNTSIFHNTVNQHCLKTVPMGERTIDRSATKQVPFLALGFIGEYGELVDAIEQKQTQGCVLDELSDVIYYGIQLIGKFGGVSDAFIREYPARNSFRTKTHFALLAHLANVAKKAARTKGSCEFDEEVVATVRFLMARAILQCYESVDRSLFDAWSIVILQREGAQILSW